MLENFNLSHIIAVTVVILSISLLAYFSWKTLRTSNFFQKGVNLLHNKDYQGAEAIFRRVISLNSTNDVVHLLLGETLMQQGKLEEATLEFQEVIRRAPKKVDAYLLLSNALIQQKNKEQAITTLQKAKDLFLTQRQPKKAEQIQQLLEKIN